MTIHLMWPFNVSLMEVEELSAIWNIRITWASTRSSVVKASMPSETYQRLFAQNPKVGEMEVPEVLQNSISRIVVDNVQEYTETQR